MLYDNNITNDDDYMNFNHSDIIICDKNVNDDNDDKYINLTEDVISLYEDNVFKVDDNMNSNDDDIISHDKIVTADDYNFFRMMMT